MGCGTSGNAGCWHRGGWRLRACGATLGSAASAIVVGSGIGAHIGSICRAFTDACTCGVDNRCQSRLRVRPWRSHRRCWCRCAILSVSDGCHRSATVPTTVHWQRALRWHGTHCRSMRTILTGGAPHAGLGGAPSPCAHPHAQHSASSGTPHTFSTASSRSVDSRMFSGCGGDPGGKRETVGYQTGAYQARNTTAFAVEQLELAACFGLVQHPPSSPGGRRCGGGSTPWRQRACARRPWPLPRSKTPGVGTPCHINPQPHG